MARLLENKWFWVCAFSLLFALSIDVWAWGWDWPVVFGLPYIIVYIAVLEAALLVMYLAFARYYWKDPEGEA